MLLNNIRIYIKIIPTNFKNYCIIGYYEENLVKQNKFPSKYIRLINNEIMMLIKI